MTGRSPDYWRVILTLLVVCGSVVWGLPVGVEVATAAGSGSLSDDTATAGENVTASGTAAERDKQRPRRFVDADTDDETPVTVYVGETLNISSVTLNDRSETIGTGDVTLSEVDGANVVSVDAGDADFGDVGTGSYSADANDSAEIRVTEPEITALSLYGSKDEDNEIISGRIDGRSVVYLDTRWNFDEADKLELTVTDPDGLEVTTQVVDAGDSESASGVVGADVADGDIAESGQDVALNFTGMPSGDYELSVTGSDFGPSRSQELTVIKDPTTVSFESEKLLQGDVAVANMTGLAGERVHLRIDDGALAEDVSTVTDSDGDVEATNATAESLFYGGEIVYRVGGQSLGIDSDSAASDDLIAVVALGDDGEARIGIRTEYIDPDEDVTFTYASEPDTGSLAERIRTAETVDEPTLNVVSRNITIRSVPEAVPTTDTFLISGTAVGVDRVAVYVQRVNGWRPVESRSGDNVAVVSNGTFTVEAVASDSLALPGGYRIGLISVDEFETTQGQSFESTAVISREEWEDLETVDTVAIRTEVGNLSAELRSDSVVVDSPATDELRLVGSAPGHGETLRLYVIGPRGTIYADDPAVGQRVDVVDSSFNYGVGELLTREGTYHVVLVGRGRDGSFAANESSLRTAVTADRTAQQQLEILNDTYRRPGVDDQLVYATFEGVDPFLSIDTLGRGDRLPPTNITILGATNRGRGHEIFVDVVAPNGTIVASGTGVVIASADTWTASIDLSGVTPGEYTVRAAGPDLEVTRNVTVVLPQTPVEQPAPQADASEQAATESAEGQDGDETPVNDPPVPGVSFIDSIQVVVAVLGAVVLLSLILLFRFRRGGG